LGAELIETYRFGRISGLQSLSGHYMFNLCLNADCFTRLCPPLLGKFQVKNAVAAVTAAWRLRQDGLKITRPAIVKGLQSTSWAGRLEKVLEHPLVLLDGAHNPAAARVLAEFIREELAGRRLRLVYASMRDKAIGEISEILFPLAEEVYLTRPNLPRAATPEEILAAARFHPARLVVELEPPVALARACQASSGEDAVMIIGSLFLVGAVKKALLEGQLHLLNHSSHAIAERLV
jgi:dihydrofolate synthase/folylpolyglutamate synthase